MGRLIILQMTSFLASNVSHLGNLRLKNPTNVIISYTNIHSIRNKFENLCDIVGNNIDVLSIAETNLTLRFRMQRAFEVGYKSSKWRSSCLYKGFTPIKDFVKV